MCVGNLYISLVVICDSCDFHSNFPDLSFSGCKLTIFNVYACSNCILTWMLNLLWFLLCLRLSLLLILWKVWSWIFSSDVTLSKAFLCNVFNCQEWILLWVMVLLVWISWFLSQTTWLEQRVLSRVLFFIFGRTQF